MLTRLYVDNFRCLQNFEFKTNSLNSLLLIGTNGTGKTTMADVLEIFQHIGRGHCRVGQLLDAKDFSYGRSEGPMRMERSVDIDGHSFDYSLAFELPVGFRELRVLDEELRLGRELLFSRKQAQVNLTRHTNESKFLVDWHLVALPVIQVQSEQDPLHIFKQWLARMVILAPVPKPMKGESFEETFEPARDASNFASWYRCLTVTYPVAYSDIVDYLHPFLPDLSDIQNEPTGKTSKNIKIRFATQTNFFTIDFDRLSDGEKCFFLLATIMAALKQYGPFLCLWDEPENYVSLQEVSQFIIALRRAFHGHGQFIAASHHEETLRRFSSENTFILTRHSHLEPTQIQLVESLDISGSLIDSVMMGEFSA